MKQFIGTLLFFSWLLVFILMCATDGPMELPARPTSPLLVAICFYTVIFGTPFLSMYLMKENK